MRYVLPTENNIQGNFEKILSTFKLHAVHYCPATSAMMCKYVNVLVLCQCYTALHSNSYRTIKVKNTKELQKINEFSWQSALVDIYLLVSSPFFTPAVSYQ